MSELRKTAGGAPVADAPPAPAQVWDGDITVFYKDTFGPLTRFIAAMLVGRADLTAAEDIAQETMMRVIEHIRGGGVDHPQRYAFVAARNATADWLRQQRSLLDRSDAGQLYSLPDPAAMWDLSQVEVNSEVSRLLDLLPRQQALMMGLQLEGYTPVEIADMIGSSPDTVRSNLRHARNKLRHNMHSRE
ncbi:RNA polymerase sigma factor [Dactylosporangium sp. CA-092794]|uniref:RNA polymerase sigma factor n=1 Tax=Dactylosporangium sp. CA-092794 TaxID=3239929 RepID=UPI003D91944B